MADTGFKVCETVVSTEWVTFSTTLINTSDDSRATVNTTTYKYSNISDFAFSIPSGATIDGIEAIAEISSNNAVVTAFIRLSLSWNNGANWTATKEASVYGLTDANRTYGGAADTWGRAWSQSEFAVGTFMVKIEGKCDAAVQCRLDYFAIKVYYTEGGVQNSRMLLVF